MGSIIPRTDSKGKTTYQVKVRVRGNPTKTATFSRITDARCWEQQTEVAIKEGRYFDCLLYTSPSPRDQRGSRMPSSA